MEWKFGSNLLFDVLFWFGRSKLNEMGFLLLVFFAVIIREKVRFYKTKSLHRNKKAKNKRTANWNTDYVGAKFAATKWGKLWDTLNERTENVHFEREKQNRSKRALSASLLGNMRARAVTFCILHFLSLSLACFVCFARAHALALAY